MASAGRIRAGVIGLGSIGLGIVGDIGRREKFPLPVAATALQLFLMTAAAGMERDDDASVACVLAGLTGVRLPEMSHED